MMPLTKQTMKNLAIMAFLLLLVIFLYSTITNIELIASILLFACIAFIVF